MLTPTSASLLAEGGGDAGWLRMPAPDQRHLADVVVVEHLGEADLVLQRGQLLHRGRPGVPRAGEGDVGLAVLDLGDVLQHHVDVDVGFGDRAKNLGGVARYVGQADDGHFRLAAVVRDSGQDGVFHGDVLDRSGDDGAGLVGVRRPDVDGNVVAAGVFHAAQHEHLRPGRRHLEHLLEGDGVQPAGVGHDARVGGEDAVDVGVDLADIGVQRGRQRDGGGVRSAAPSVVTSLLSWLTPWNPRPGRSAPRPARAQPAMR